MRYFIDTEFIESGPKNPIQLISIGIVAEDLRQLYRISSEFNPEDASQWVKETVLMQLEPSPSRRCCWRQRSESRPQRPSEA